MKKLLLLSAFLLVAAAAFSQSIVGVWKTIDDEEHVAKSNVEITEKDGKYSGKVAELLRPAHVNDACTKCDDYRKDQPVKGMLIVENLYKNGSEWVGGQILDPTKGKIYSCKMWLEDNNTLKVRGFLGISLIGRTQTWYRVK